MEDRIYLVVRLKIKTTHKRIEKAIEEIERNTKLIVPDTPNVKIKEVEILRTQ